ncbi:MAG: hypothetical protein MK085_09380 [Phycisphaerales bacterium]|nr:hypothetical protein [Phycisphaerales bacterium]
MHRSTVIAALAAAVFGGIVGVNLDRPTGASSLTTVMEQARAAVTATATTHCEIPCGIFDDHAEVEGMRLDAQTIQKANAQIQEIMFSMMQAGDPMAAAQAANTAMRWVMVKEEHARKIQHTVAWYFVAQRVKAPAGDDADAREKYHQQLASFHGVTVAAMKAAQDSDPGSAERLFAAIDAVAPWYPAKPDTPDGAHP